MTPDSSINILIVDDEPLVREGLKTILKNLKEKYNIKKIDEAADGRQAVECLKSEAYDILFSDIVMPNMNGIELLAWISANRPSVNRVVLSCHDDYKYVRDSFKNEVADYILKYDISSNLVEELLDKITAKIGKESVHPENETNNDSRIFQFTDFHPEPGSYFMLLHLRYQGLELNIKQIEGWILKYSSTFALSETLSLKKVYYLEHDSNSALFLLISDKPMEHAYFQGISKGIKSHFPDSNFEVSILCSSDFKDHRSINTWIERMHHHYTHVFISGDGIYNYNDFVSLKTEKPSDLIKLKYTIYKEISEKHFLKVSDLLKLLYRQFQMSSISIDEIKKIHIEFIDLIFLLYRDALGSISDLEIKKIRQNIQEAAFLSSLNLIIENIIEKITLNEIFLNDESKVSMGIRRALVYIYSHYHSRGLSLAEISDKLNYSASYLSRQFKKELGENVVSYINNLRLIEAQKLIKTGKYLIYEISDIVGFSNYNYFSRLYKQKFGKSPKEDI